MDTNCLMIIGCPLGEITMFWNEVQGMYNKVSVLNSTELFI